MEEFRYMQSKWLYGFALIRHLVEELNPSPDMQAFYLGCGFGKIVEYLVQQFGCKVTATDISRMVVGKAEARILKNRWKSRISFTFFEYDNLILDQEAFDFIVIETLTSFVVDRERILGSYAKALKRGGKMGILELVWLRKPPEQLSEKIRMKFGVQANILNDQEFRGLFSKFGLQLCGGCLYHLSLLQKGLDDFRYDTSESFFELLKTFNTIIKTPVTRQIALDFLSFYREYPKFLGIAEYVYLKPN